MAGEVDRVTAGGRATQRRGWPGRAVAGQKGQGTHHSRVAEAKSSLYRSDSGATGTPGPAP